MKVEGNEPPVVMIMFLLSYMVSVLTVAICFTQAGILVQWDKTLIAFSGSLSLAELIVSAGVFLFVQKVKSKRS